MKTNTSKFGNGPLWNVKRKGPLGIHELKMSQIRWKIDINMYEMDPQYPISD